MNEFKYDKHPEGENDGIICQPDGWDESDVCIP